MSSHRTQKDTIAQVIIDVLTEHIQDISQIRQTLHSSGLSASQTRQIIGVLKNVIISQH